MIMGTPTSLYRMIFGFFCLALLYIVQPNAIHAQQPTAADTVVSSNSNGKIPITQQDYENQEIEMADAWRANGKIYVVIAVITSLLLGLVAFLVFLERRISKLEVELKE